LYSWGALSTWEGVGVGWVANPSSVPVQNPTLPAGVTPTAVSTGSTTLALGSDGNVYAWGDLVGDGNEAPSSTPVLAPLPGGVTATAVSTSYGGVNLVLGSDGNVYAWGADDDGQIGDGSLTGGDVVTPVQALLPAGITATAVSSGATSLALGSDGNVYAWGSNTWGALGIGTIAVGSSTTPVRVSLPTGVTATAIASGYNTNLAVGSDGNVYAWGNGQYGQLGNGTTDLEATTPVRVSLPGGVAATAVSEGYYSSLALGSDGNVYAWGFNGAGQLGDGSTADSPTPVRVSLPGGVTATAVSAGGEMSVALGSDGNIYSWGNNQDGELGDASSAGSLTPVQVLLPDGAAATATAVSEAGGAGLAIANAATGVSTTTSVTVSTTFPSVGNIVGLTATVASAGGIATPAGSVQFQTDGTDIGTPVPLNADGMAATSTRFAAAGNQTPVWAVYIPADPAAFNASAGMVSVVVNPALPDSDDIPLTTAVPQNGTFTLTVDTADTVTLAVSGSSAAAATTPIIVSDTRNTYPGWSVSGQGTNWTGSGTAAGATISGNQLGWTPSSTGTLPQGVMLGSPVTPASPGLGSTPAVLASAPQGVGNGFGTTTLGASLTLLIPAGQATGSYTSGLTITAATANP
jgi:alpha-tubulin suppressor-like RCC1 family protein